MKTLLTFVAVSFSLALFACAKKPQPIIEVEPPVVEEEETAYVPPPPPPPPREDPLEAERRRLEELMNRIMSEDVYFEFDQATLTARARTVLTEVSDILKREPRFTILTEGHTDERGTESYNLGLGMRRAESVVQFLVNSGVSSNRLTRRSFGKEQPKAAGSSEEAWAQNRRAAFRVQITN
ncbi:MAG: OmpA family protein [Fibromonadaceae bacterium]|jgi:peptidoglycan-associated lipoprotein|nr:OmpA family protein [Fibromonadaceae bacterium]